MSSCPFDLYIFTSLQMLHHLTLWRWVRWQVGYWRCHFRENGWELQILRVQQNFEGFLGIAKLVLYMPTTEPWILVGKAYTSMLYFLFISSVTLSKWLSLSEPQFPYLKMTSIKWLLSFLCLLFTTSPVSPGNPFFLFFFLRLWSLAFIHWFCGHPCHMGFFC